MVLGQVFTPRAIIIDLESEDKDELFEELVEQYVRMEPGADRSKILDAINDREEKMTTGIMHGVAVPHGRCDAVAGVRGIIGVSRNGIDYNSLDDAPVHIVFLVLSSPFECELHLRVLKRLAQILQDPAVVTDLMNCKSAESLYKTLCRYEDALSSGV